ncbi:Uncharacterized protein APZ42_005238 [Daphnia magna]|uniref:Uncharacterized protein n=1 Tax=Daphnia magna TaxID=35525 RepID=A0A164GKA2_9CRUS|nr:Uncharacterized protein APZ42_005238 [Daphnia magna]
MTTHSSLNPFHHAPSCTTHFTFGRLFRGFFHEKTLTTGRYVTTQKFGEATQPLANTDTHTHTQSVQNNRMLIYIYMYANFFRARTMERASEEMCPAVLVSLPSHSRMIAAT